MQNNKTITDGVVFKTCSLLDFTEAPPVSLLLEQRYIAVSTEGSAADLKTLNEPLYPTPINPHTFKHSLPINN